MWWEVLCANVSCGWTFEEEGNKGQHFGAEGKQHQDKDRWWQWQLKGEGEEEQQNGGEKEDYVDEQEQKGIAA